MHRDSVLLVLGSLCCVVAACGDAFKGSGDMTSGASAGGGSKPTAGSAHAGITTGGKANGAGSDAAGESAAGEPSGESDGGVPSGGTAGGGSTAGGETAGSGGTQPTEPIPCESLADCATAQNCIDDICVAALNTCAAQKNAYPASKDGVYWIGKDAASLRTYCDMAESIALCSEVEGQHEGRTRDSSALSYTMMSLLLPDEGLCKMWALRASADGYPLWQLEAVAGVPAGQTCINLGFAADGVLGNCSYGSSRTNCGFEVTPLHRYANNCTGCQLNDGTYDHWLLQGPTLVGAVLSTMSGADYTTCKTSK